MTLEFQQFTLTTDFQHLTTFPKRNNRSLITLGNHLFDVVTMTIPLSNNLRKTPSSKRVEPKSANCISSKQSSQASPANSEAMDSTGVKLNVNSSLGQQRFQRFREEYSCSINE